MKNRNKEHIENKENIDINDIKLCFGLQCKCKKGHEWLSAIGGEWLVMPTCPKCYSLAIAHRGYWKSIGKLLEVYKKEK